MPAASKADELTAVLERGASFFDSARGVPLQLSMLLLLLSTRKQAIEAMASESGGGGGGEYPPRGLEFVLEKTGKGSLPEGQEALYRMAIRCALQHKHKQTEVADVAMGMLRHVATAVMLKQARDFDQRDVAEVRGGVAVLVWSKAGWLSLYGGSQHSGFLLWWGGSEMASCYGGGGARWLPFMAGEGRDSSDACFMAGWNAVASFYGRRSSSTLRSWSCGSA